MNTNLLNYYKKVLNYEERPEFLKKYENTPSLLRLKKIGYFCGMDYASKDVYSFKEKISRYDHSITTALLTWNLSNNRIETLAALFHDISTPCFSHVIDYMNNDYKKQESTEEFTEQIIKKDEVLTDLLKKDFILVDDIVNFKKYSIVDNNRPKICADRLDGIILTGISWTKNIGKEDIKNILNNIKLYNNENNEYEIGFTDKEIAKKIVFVNKNINKYCHTNEDNYMMELLADITKKAINKGIIKYSDLYVMNEELLINLLSNSVDTNIRNAISLFKIIKRNNIPKIELNNVKDRVINPLVNGKRLIKKA